MLCHTPSGTTKPAGMGPEGDGGRRMLQAADKPSSGVEDFGVQKAGWVER